MNLARRSLIALPDAAAAGLFLWCWIAPTAWRQLLVGFLVLVLLIEFVVMQAGPFLGAILYGEKMGLNQARRTRIAVVLGSSYFLFAGLAAASFDAWFPFFIFVWLFGVKVVAAVVGFDRNATGREPEMTIWILSATYYFGAIFLTFFVPFPMLGITEDGAVYGLRGQYEWANAPYKAIAAGFLYFFALSVTRLFMKGTSLDLSTSDAPAGTSDADPN